MYQVSVKIEGVVPIMFSRFPLPAKPGDSKKKKKQTVEEKYWKDKFAPVQPKFTARNMSRKKARSI